ncbi:MAG TPA: hypothetical protein V6D48_04545 [Oculatellaceae cyanobacterium]
MNAPRLDGMGMKIAPRLTPRFANVKQSPCQASVERIVLNCFPVKVKDITDSSKIAVYYWIAFKKPEDRKIVDIVVSTELMSISVVHF